MKVFSWPQNSSLTIKKSRFLQAAKNLLFYNSVSANFLVRETEMFTEAAEQVSWLVFPQNFLFTLNSQSLGAKFTVTYFQRKCFEFEKQKQTFFWTTLRISALTPFFRFSPKPFPKTEHNRKKVFEKKTKIIERNGTQRSKVELSNPKQFKDWFVKNR